AITWGAPPLRKAIAEKVRRFNGIPCDPDENVTVCCGATECMMATMLALVNPGDEVVIFQPFYENYGPDALLSGAKPVWVTLHPPDWHIDLDELRRAFSRSEEHTSELQSPYDLVCRLLLEKKKKNNNTARTQHK